MLCVLGPWANQKCVNGSRGKTKQHAGLASLRKLMKPSLFVRTYYVTHVYRRVIIKLQHFPKKKSWVSWIRCCAFFARQKPRCQGVSVIRCEDELKTFLIALQDRGNNLVSEFSDCVFRKTWVWVTNKIYVCFVE